MPDPLPTEVLGIPPGAGPAFYADLDTPGVVVEVDPDDADEAGAFEEDALTEAAAFDARFDLRTEV